MGSLLRTTTERENDRLAEELAALRVELAAERAAHVETREERESLHVTYRGLYALWLRVAHAMTPVGGPDITDEEVAKRAEAVSREAAEWRRNAEVVERAANAWRDDALKLEAEAAALRERVERAEAQHTELLGAWERCAEWERAFNEATAHALALRARVAKLEVALQAIKETTSNASVRELARAALADAPEPRTFSGSEPWFPRAPDAPGEAGPKGCPDCGAVGAEFHLCGRDSEDDTPATPDGKDGGT